MPKAGGAKTKSGRKADNERNLGSLTLPQATNYLGTPNRAGFWQSQNLGLLFSWAARHKKALLYAVGVAVAVLAVLAPMLFYQAPTAELQVGNHTVPLEIAETNVARTKGLSGRKSLAANKGMILVFSKAGKRCLQMKGMEFPLDMVFVSHAKQVVRIQPDVLPRTYPKSFCADTTQYVIELNAGRAAALGLQPSQTLSF